MAANGSTGSDSSSAMPSNIFVQHGFKITTRKLPILKAGPIAEMTNALGSGWFIKFDAFDALDRVDKTGDAMLKVAHSKEWQRSRQAKREHHHEGIKEVVKPFDWSYSTAFKGTASAGPAKFQPSSMAIPVELLKRPDPILFFDEVMLYEDELADNGITMLSGKIRVMPDRLLLLCRFFMRLDDVVFRIRDTRVYIEFATGDVIREYTAREDSFETVRRTLASTREDVPALMRDANKLAPMLPIVEQVIEHLVVPVRASMR